MVQPIEEKFRERIKQNPGESEKLKNELELAESQANTLAERLAGIDPVEASKIFKQAFRFFLQTNREKWGREESLFDFE